MKELKPCPFCGEKHVMHEQGHVIVTETARSGPRYGVSCYSCGGRIEFFDTEAEAIDAWNTRAEQTCKLNMDTEYYEGDLDSFMCTNCGWEGYLDDGYPQQTIPNFCPNCGAKVVGSDEAKEV